MRNVKKPLVLLLSMLIACMLGLPACAGGTSGSAGSTEDDATEASTTTEATDSSELSGKPWVTSVLQGNLPDEAPAAKDDLYTHYAYDWLKEHQEAPATVKNMLVAGAEIPTLMAGIITDESISNHDLDQMRVLYNQAADFETLKETGLSEVQPYLDRIDAVTSLDELEALLTGDDFPFSPFVLSLIGTSDLRANYIVSVGPNLLYADPLLSGGIFYQDAESEEQQAAFDAGLTVKGQDVLVDQMAMGVSQEDAYAEFKKLTAFEKTYGKYADYAGEYNGQGYGANAQATKDGLLTLDEMCDLCPNFPLRETLQKLGKAGSSLYSTKPAWLKAFNNAWTDDNLDNLKTIARNKVLQETRPYRDPTGFNEIMGPIGGTVQDETTFAYNACGSLDTFAQVLAKSYVDEVVGPEAKTRMTSMTNDLLDVYRDLINETPWIGDESKAALIEKVDHMTLNILEPDGGYFDYSDLELKTTEEGGTLFSNYLTLKQYRLDRESELVNTPAHATYSWLALGPIVNNAFYDSSNNSINVNPGYMSRLTYNADMSEADMFSTIGFTLAHEISHAFDYSGSQYNAYGEPTPVFAKEDVDAFVQKTTSLADYYSTIEVAPGTKVDGTNVVGEAAADLSGMQAILVLGDKTDGFDYETFCSQYANYWASVANEATFPVLVADTHPLDNLRMNVCSQMFDTMYDKLGVKEGDGMYLAPEDRIVIWGAAS